jgi:hypothetical protein
LQWTRRRLRCSITTNTYNSRNVAVTTTMKSQAMIPWACTRRNVDQRKLFRGRPGGRGASTSARFAATPEFPASTGVHLRYAPRPMRGFRSPWQIKARNCRGIGGRPGRDLSRLNNLHPARCRWIIVSGRTATSASRQSKNFESIDRKIRVAGSIRRRFAPRST